MSDYIISCCSIADLNKEHFEQRGIKVAYMRYSIGEEEYQDDLGASVPYSEFYGRMAQGEMTRTSQMNPAEYVEYFESIMEGDKPILHLTLSSGLTGTYNSAVAGAQMFMEDHPNVKVYVVDSLGASSGAGLLIDAMADKRDEGMSVEELYDWTMENRLRVNHWFFSTDLKYYVRGGRISKTEGFVGGMLKICPLCNMDSEGHLIPREKIRTKKKVIQTIVERMEQYAEDGLDYSGKCFISHADCYEDARAVADLVEERFPNLNGKVEINYIGTIVGSHTGPGTVALFFFGRERTEKG